LLGLTSDLHAGTRNKLLFMQAPDGGKPKSVTVRGHNARRKKAKLRLKGMEGGASHLKICWTGSIWVVEKREEWVKTATGARKRARNLFLIALLETQNFIGELEINPEYEPSGDEKKRLSKAWMDAAEAVMEYDEDLYHRCLSKCSHWSGCSAVEESVLAELDTSIEAMLKIAADRERLKFEK